MRIAHNNRRTEAEREFLGQVAEMQLTVDHGAEFFFQRLAPLLSPFKRFER